MGLFGNSEKGGIRALFASDSLDEIVWRENIDNLSNGAAFVDVVVSSPKPALLQDIRKVGLTYWPNGPVVRGVQNYTVGTSVTFAAVPVKQGGVLALASETSFGDSLPARVDVVPVGAGSRTEADRRGQSGDGLLDKLTRDASLVLGIAVIAGILYILVQAKKVAS